MESIVRNVKDIDRSEKRVLEDALGKQLNENQRVLIMVLSPDAPADEAIREKALASLQELATRGEEHARAEGLGEQEGDRAVDEAMEHVRPRS